MIDWLDGLFIILPSLVFWVVAGGLHLSGVNRYYKGKVTVTDMVACQIGMIDSLQLIGGVIQYCIQTEENAQRPISFLLIFLGLIYIDCVEYLTHRLIHNVSFLKQWHKAHHSLLQVHTLGSFYNDWRELLFTVPFLSVGIYLCGPNLMEVSITSSLSVLLTIKDHTPVAPGQPPRHHHLHHSRGPNSNFAQPLGPFLDILFHTTFSERYPKLICSDDNEIDTKQNPTTTIN